MPVLTGDLKTVTDSPSQVRKVLLRAKKTRPHGGRVVIAESVHVPVSGDGTFSVTALAGEAVLVLIGSGGVAWQSIPLHIAEDTTTIAEAMQAAELSETTPADKLSQLAKEVAGGLARVREAAGEVQTRITQAASSTISQARSYAEAASRDAATAGQHALRAQAAERNAAQAASNAAAQAVNRILAGASEQYDTLKEVGDELVNQKSAAAAIMKTLSEKANTVDLSALRSRIDSLSIASISGLAAALGGKANSSHTHSINSISGLQTALNSKLEIVEGNTSSRDGKLHIVYES
ncbi:hypothetical protein ACFLIN_03715 [Corynebacterium kutscheri]|uniref:hypothetical protein n=1 Tax=Corynebacterium kutscheri TaxID=35755 RepID=UPI0037BE282D